MRQGADQAGRAPEKDKLALQNLVWPIALSQTLCWGCFFYVFPALLPTWESHFGWSKNALTGALTLALALSALLAPFSGRLVDRAKSQVLHCSALLLGAGCLVALSFVQTLWQFYLVWALLGLVMSSALYETSFAIITRAMKPYARMAITRVTLLAGFAGTICFPSAHFLSEALGWRGALQIFAATILLVALPLAWQACRFADRRIQADSAETSFHYRQTLGVLKDWIFWLLGFSTLCFALDQGAVISHLLPLLSDRNLPEGTVILAASMLGPMQVAGRFFVLIFERHLPNMMLAIGCYLSVAIAAVSLLGTPALPLLVFGFCFFQGLGQGVTSIMRPLVISRLLGTRDFGSIAGLLAIPFVGGMALSPILGSWVWQIGGYDLFLVLAASMALIGALCLGTCWLGALRREKSFG